MNILKLSFIGKDLFFSKFVYYLEMFFSFFFSFIGVVLKESKNYKDLIMIWVNYEYNEIIIYGCLFLFIMMFLNWFILFVNFLVV